jgi:hypothetical protein
MFGGCCLVKLQIVAVVKGDWLIDHTHAAATELLDNAVMRNSLADHWRESYVGELPKNPSAPPTTNS